MNLTEKVLNIIENSKKFPVVITNKDLPLIEESANICQVLESEGYKVETFVKFESGTYGIKVNK